MVNGKDGFLDNRCTKAGVGDMGSFLVSHFLVMKSHHLCESSFIFAKRNVALQCLMESHQFFWMYTGR